MTKNQKIKRLDPPYFVDEFSSLFFFIVSILHLNSVSHLVNVIITMAIALVTPTLLMWHGAASPFHESARPLGSCRLATTGRTLLFCKQTLWYVCTAFSNLHSSAAPKPPGALLQSCSPPLLSESIF